ncbi:hypothetical protein EW026_g2939 [Hermanssonia centrifuga]|uniref:Xylanolytic transcriptional activator regulatory domain-containing protein n=1 Tax=Hermanssonia centrifuga TaxID=98765 RepID=A0A4S4KMS3_9APHY|nr:hypothetical protein EW026_g2939 [Hermanssonia centrifuga]
MAPSRAKKEPASPTPPSDDAAPKDSSENSKIKRKARKVRCARENPDDPKQSCKHCIALGIPCTYDYQPKKRGPPNLYLRRLQEAQAAQAASHQDGTNGSESVQSPTSTTQKSASPSHTAMSTSPQLPSPYLEPSLSSIPPPMLNGSLPPSRYPIAADGFHAQYPTMSSLNPSTFGQPNGIHSRSPPREEPSFTPTEQFSTYPLFNWSFKQHQALPIPPPTAIPPLSYYYRPHRLEDIAPRDTILLIIALFFDFVYPLTPCVHKPSFMADVHARREERDPLFFALVMSTVASTLVQVPRSYLPMERHAVRKLAQTCHEASRHISVASYDPPTSMHVVVRYFDCVYHFCEGHDATQHAAFGETAHIAVTLRMHEESSYEGLDPIECEGQFLTARLEEVQALHARIVTALAHTPEPLRLKHAHSQSHIPPEYGGAGFRQATFAEVKDFFDNPNASRANALNPFLVMQANLYVTQQLVRFVIEQYRDELVTSLQGAVDESRVAEDREAVASDLLNILHSIPIQSIATNGPSLVHKVRFVASTLLDAVRKAETAPASAARAHAYLWDFLSILSEIERNYLLDDDRDGTSSADGIPLVGGQ